MDRLKVAISVSVGTFLALIAFIEIRDVLLADILSPFLAALVPAFLMKKLSQSIFLSIINSLSALSILLAVIGFPENILGYDRFFGFSIFVFVLVYYILVSSAWGLVLWHASHLRYSSH